MEFDITEVLEEKYFPNTPEIISYWGWIMLKIWVESGTCVYLYPYVYVHRCPHAETKLSTKTPLPCGLMNDQELFPNHILKELSYESRQYLAIPKHPFITITHSLQWRWESLPFRRPEQTLFYDLLQSKAEQMATFLLRSKHTLRCSSRLMCKKRVKMNTSTFRDIKRIQFFFFLIPVGFRDIGGVCTYVGVGVRITKKLGFNLLNPTLNLTLDYLLQQALWNDQLTGVSEAQIPQSHTVFTGV